MDNPEFEDRSAFALSRGIDPLYIGSTSAEVADVTVLDVVDVTVEAADVLALPVIYTTNTHRIKSRYPS